jgi:membrane-associated phospholipid phosphatase
MNKFIAAVISTIINPLIILAILPYILIVKSTGSFSAANFWTIFSLIFILIFGVVVYIGVEKGYFSDLDISQRKQRPALYALATGMSFFYIIFLYFLKAPGILYVALVGLMIGLISMEFVNRFTKASVHVATISAFATAMTVGFGLVYSLFFILVPLVAWARIKTHNHTKRQTVIGAMMGILITLSVYVIFKYIV